MILVHWLLVEEAGHRGVAFPLYACCNPHQGGSTKKEMRKDECKEVRMNLSEIGLLGLAAAQGG
jgi:hypothetical protein